MKSLKILAVVFIAVSFSFFGCKQNDTEVQNKLNDKLKEQENLAGVNATVDNGVATLTGTVSSEADKSSAETIARQVDGVDSVHNNISLPIPSDSVQGVPDAGSGLIADEHIMDSAKALTKDYPDVHVSVAGGVITVTGTIEKSKKDALIESLKGLSAHGVTDQLQVK